MSISTSNIGRRVDGTFEEYAPPNVVTIAGGGGVNPDDLVITAQNSALGLTYLPLAMLSLGTGSWHVFGRLSAAFIQDGSMIGLNTAPGDTFAQALVSATNTTGGNVTDLTAGPISLSGPVTFYLKGQGIGSAEVAQIVAQRMP